MTKLLLLGLDGGDLDYIQSRSSMLPCLDRVIKSNQVFSLDAPVALSGSVWPTFYNGEHPGVHGIYQHLVWDKETMGIRRIGADWCYYQPFWQDIEESGHQGIILDVPYSFPCALKKGIEITDWATHGQTWPLDSNRDDIKKMIQQFGKSPIGRETPIKKTPTQLTKIKHQLLESAQLKGKLIQKLMNQPQWELLVAIFGETHRGGHLFFNDRDEQEYDGESTLLLEVYQAVDRALAEIINHRDHDTQVVIFSAHGMARDYAQGHMIRPIMKKLNQIFREKYGKKKTAIKVQANSIVPFLRQIVPSRLQYTIGTLAPDIVRQWVVEKEMVGSLDWSQTPGFALRTDIRTELRLNVIGRESQGILEPNSQLHHQYVDLIKEVFLNLRDSQTQEILVDEVIDTHQLFSATNVHLLPDLVITWQDKPVTKSVYSPLIGNISSPAPTVRGGDHTDYGFAIVPPELANLSELNKIEDLATFTKKFFGINHS